MQPLVGAISYPFPEIQETKLNARKRLVVEIVRKEACMLWTIFVILVVLWLLGIVTSYTLGGFIHLLLVLAVVVLLIRVLQGRSVVD